MSPVLQIENLGFSYPRGPEVLRIPSFQILKGEKVFLHGPSGSGKTSLLGLVSGVLTPTQGSISLLGQNISTLSASKRDRFRADHLGIIFQQFNLVPYLNVVENVVLATEVSAVKKKRLEGKSDAAEAHRLLDALGLAHSKKKSVLELSVGQQQRVAVARALIGRPELIIADEPTSALDAELRTDFLKLLFNQVKEANCSLIFVSHDRSLSSDFDRSVSLAELNR